MCKTTNINKNLLKKKEEKIFYNKKELEIKSKKKKNIIITVLIDSLFVHNYATHNEH